MLLRRRQEIVGIDIGLSSIKFVQLAAGNDGLPILTGYGSIPLEVQNESGTPDVQVVTDALTALRKRYPGVARKAVASVSANSVIIRTMTFIADTEDELEYQVSFEAENQVPYDISDTYLDFQVQGGFKGGAQQSTEVVVVIGRRTLVDNIAAAFAAADLQLSIVDVDSFALVNAFEHNYLPAADESAVLVNIGAAFTTISIVQGGALVFTRAISIGGNAASEALATGLRISREEADSVKRSSLALADPAVSACLDAAGKRLAEEVRKNLNFHNLGTEAGHIYLSGGGSSLPGLQELFSSTIGIPCHRLNPFKRINIDADKVDAADLEQQSGTLAVAVGLAMRNDANA